MEYINIPSSTNEYFVLFHGTGGNEYSLLTVTGDIDPHASIISFLGNEGIGADRRFFKPLHQGLLQREDFDQRVDQFLKQWDEIQPTDAESLTFIGYSNGANFVLGILEKRPAIANNIVLLHPSNLGYAFAQGSDSHIILTTGANDTLSIPGEVMKLAKQLREQFPETTLELLDTGHEATPEDARLVKQFLTK